MKGKVSLIGAGPGNPEYLTVLGQRRLQEADVVLYDRLVNPSLLAATRADVELIDVGKLPKAHKVSQFQINDMLVKLAMDGKQVVRLKAGDPYVFGRGGEEAQALIADGVEVEVVPGITSAIAGLAAAGIPITHRDYASSFHVITGHHKVEGTQLDWENISSQEGTLVFLMGMAELTTIVQQLVDHGKSPETPVAIIQWATQWRQKKVLGTLETIAELVSQSGIGAPALIVVGEVVQLSQLLDSPRPLSGLHFLVPFSEHNQLFKQLQDAGATADFYSRSVTVDDDGELPDLSQFAAIQVDTGYAFQRLTALLMQNGTDLRALTGMKVIVPNAAVGHRLQQFGIQADEFVDHASGIQPVLEVGCAGQQFDSAAIFLPLYHQQAPRQTVIDDVAGFNGVIFPSSASVQDFVDQLTEQQLSILQAIPAFAMGPKVANQAHYLGFSQVIECESSIERTIEQLQEVMKRE